jgi:pantothenate kinase
VKNIDILSAHYYGSGPYATLMAKSENIAYSAGKVFMVDEYGTIK